MDLIRIMRDKSSGSIKIVEEPLDTSVMSFESHLHDVSVPLHAVQPLPPLERLHDLKIVMKIDELENSDSLNSHPPFVSTSPVVTSR